MRYDLKLLLYQGKSSQSLVCPSAISNKFGPTGIGYSSARKSSATRPVKYSQLIFAMDYILQGRVSFKQHASGEIYFEIHHSNGAVEKGSAMIDSNQVSIVWENEVKLNVYQLIPTLILFVCNKASKEVTSAFISMVKSYKTSGSVTAIDMMKLCDAFYYDIVLDQGVTDLSSENTFIEGPFKQAFQKGLFSTNDIFKDVTMPSLSIENGIKTTKIKEREKKEEQTNFFEDCKAGKYILSFPWSEEAKTKIPDLTFLDSYIPTSKFTFLVKKINKRLNKCLERVDQGMDNVSAILNDYINFFLTGRPGTGKTTTAYALASALGLPIYSIALTKNTEEDEFQGKTKAINGKFQFVETDFLKAYENGGIVVLEEVNLANQDLIMGALGQAIEKPFILQKDGYIPVYRHPLCVIINTMNVGTNGSKALQQAFANRSKQSYILDDPNKDDFIKILMKQGYTKKDCSWVYGAYDKVLNLLNSDEYQAEDIALNLSMRTCLGALENIEDGEEPIEALIDTLIGKIAESDLALADDVKKQVIDNLPELK